MESTITFTNFQINAALAIDGVHLHNTSTHGSLSNDSDLKNLYDYIDEMPKKFMEVSKRSKFLDKVDPGEIEIVKAYSQHIHKSYGMYYWNGSVKHIIDDLIINYNVGGIEGQIIMTPLRELGKENIFLKLDHIKTGNGRYCMKDAEEEYDSTLYVLKALKDHFAEVKPELIDIFIKNIRIRQNEAIFV